MKTVDLLTSSRMKETLSAQQHLLICVVLLSVCLIGFVSACDPNCATTCFKYTCCDGTCKAPYGINTTSHCCGRCESLCHNTSACNAKGPGTCDKQCILGYCPDWVNRKCQSVPHCIICNSTGYPKCDLCEKGYIASNGSCREINECISNPCKNGGTCVDGVNSYTCICSPCYTGAQCQTDYDECISAPCQNGATCTHGVCWYNCSCPPCYTGIQCQTNIDECASSPCQNGGTCTDGVCSYTCSCPAGYTGPDCQTASGVTPATPPQTVATTSSTVSDCDVNCAEGCAVRGTGYCDDACVPGYSLNTAFNCILCDANCAGGCVVQGAGKCDDVCAAGYSINSTYNCIRCDSYCAEGCSSQGVDRCDTVCRKGYGLSASFYCQVSPIVSTTTTTPRPTTTSASGCDPNCIGGCSAAGVRKCDTVCKPGYSLNSTQNCIQCDPSCVGGCSLQGAGKCDVECNIEYSLNSTFTCIMCAAHCVGGCLTEGSGYCDCPCASGYDCLPNPTFRAKHSCYASTVSLTTAVSHSPTTTPPNLVCAINCAAVCSSAGSCPFGGCAAGYGSVLVNGSRDRYTCAACDPQCAVASSCNVQGGAKCDETCTAGYSLSPSFTCYQCSVFCEGGCLVEGPGFCDCPCVSGYNCVLSPDNPSKHICSLNSGLFTTPATNVTYYDVCKLDIAVLVDCSGSIGAGNWPTIINFLNYLLYHIQFGLDKTRLAVVTFGSRQYIQFYLDSYSDVASASSAIIEMAFCNEGTDMAAGLRVVRQNIFDINSGDRPSVPNICIIISDGYTYPYDLVQQEIALFRDSDIRVMAVGISNVNVAFLKSVITYAEEDYFYMNSNNWNRVVYSVVDSIYHCECRVDLVFLVDCSDSIRPPDTYWPLILSFIDATVQQLNTATYRLHVAVVTFGSWSQLEFELGYYDTATLSSQIFNIQYCGGGTDIVTGLQTVITQAFVSPGDRPMVPNVCILITDGYPANSDSQIAAEMNNIHAANIRVIGVGVGNPVNTITLKTMITYPDKDYFYLQDYSGLPSLAGSVAGASCRAGCRLDLAFLVDCSGSIDYSNWQLILTFIDKAVTALRIIFPSRIRVSVVTFNYSPHVQFLLNNGYSQATMSSVINSIVFYDGGTNIYAALTTIRTVVFNEQNGDRPAVPNVCVVITDGQDSLSQITKAASEFIDANIRIVGVGVSYVSTSNMNALVTYPDEEYFRLGSWSDLSSVTSNVTDAVCNTECRVDIAFLVDCSGSIGIGYWPLITNFINAALAELTTASYRTRTAIVTFSTQANIQYYLSNIKPPLSIQFCDGESNIDLGLAAVRTGIFTASADRPGVPDVCVVITDAEYPQQKASYVNFEIWNLRNANVRLIGVGVGQFVNWPNMLSMIKYEADIFNLGSTADVASVSSGVAERSCQRCSCKVDLAFLIDCSGSIRASNWPWWRQWPYYGWPWWAGYKVYDNWLLIKQFVNNVVRELDVDKCGSRVAVVTFGNYATVQFYLDKYTDYLSLSTAINRISFCNGMTNTVSGLETVRSQIFTTTHGDRKNVPNLCIIITDGYSSNSPYWVQTAVSNLINSNIYTIGVAVTDYVNWASMWSLVQNRYEDVFRLSYHPYYYYLPPYYPPITFYHTSMTLLTTRVVNSVCRHRLLHGNGLIVRIPRWTFPWIYGIYCSGECYYDYYNPWCGCLCYPRHVYWPLLASSAYSCQPCSANCIGGCAVNGPGFCDCPCEHGYACGPSTTDSSKQACYPCEALCTGSCQTPGTCNDTCAVGYCVDLADYHCKPVSHCVSCHASGYPLCDVCDTGYSAVNGVCAVSGCDNHCHASSGCAVQGSGRCDASCAQGYVLDPTTYTCAECQSVNPGSCASCSVAGQCDICGSRDAVPIDGVCSRNATNNCDVHCLISSGCAVQGPGRCDVLCAQGYVLDSTTYTCAACQTPNPERCAYCIVAGTCEVCVSGAALVNGFCGDVSCDGIDECASNPCQNGGTCTDGDCSYTCTCPRGFGGTECQSACERLCMGTCDIGGAGTCDDLCYTGYCPNATHHCRAVYNCVSCGASYPDCEVCIAGYSLINGICAECDDHCVVPCTEPDTCPPGGCVDPGYASITLTGTTQTACAPCDVNCNGSCKVHGGGKCDATCTTGYTLNTTTYTCSACGSNCAGGCAVSGPGFCDCPCKPGYVCAPTPTVPTKSACYPCAVHCTSGCTEGKGCCDSTCAAGYTWTLTSSSPLCHVCV